MEISYKTMASVREVLQGININLSAEYENKNTPGLVSFYCEGNLIKEKQQQQSNYLNFSGTYDFDQKVFSSINGASLPADFLPGLELKIVEFYNTIKGV